MSTATIRRPDGTLSTYTVTNPASWAALEAVKPARKPRPKAEKRRYPSQAMSTADYVRQYYALNTRSRTGEINAYGAHLNHITLFQPLNEEPCHWAPDTVEIEVLE
tara:strand:+ start:3981 stop:4298 length:318 start_codon:yes stop_codon:yes gene_type:complete